jgi:hypothetical protein
VEKCVPTPIPIGPNFDLLVKNVTDLVLTSGFSQPHGKALIPGGGNAAEMNCVYVELKCFLHKYRV